MLNKLREAVEKTHNCGATYVNSVAVAKRFQEQMTWQGIVEMFDLTGHPTAKRCYAWSYEAHGAEKFMTVLEIPPVCSAETAVKAAMADREIRRPKNQGVTNFQANG
jgi:hypothetical protein